MSSLIARLSQPDNGAERTCPERLAGPPELLAAAPRCDATSLAPATGAGCDTTSPAASQWLLEDGLLDRTLEGCMSYACSACMTPAGERVATASVNDKPEEEQDAIQPVPWPPKTCGLLSDVGGVRRWMEMSATAEGCAALNAELSELNSGAAGAASETPSDTSRVDCGCAGSTPRDGGARPDAAFAETLPRDVRADFASVVFDSAVDGVRGECEQSPPATAAMTTTSADEMLALQLQSEFDEEARGTTRPEKSAHPWRRALGNATRQPSQAHDPFRARSFRSPRSMKPLGRRHGAQRHSMWGVPCPDDESRAGSVASGSLADNEGSPPRSALSSSRYFKGIDEGTPGEWGQSSDFMGRINRKTVRIQCPPEQCEHRETSPPPPRPHLSTSAQGAPPPFRTPHAPHARRNQLLAPLRAARTSQPLSRWKHDCSSPSSPQPRLPLTRLAAEGLCSFSPPRDSPRPPPPGPCDASAACGECASPDALGVEALTDGLPGEQFLHATSPQDSPKADVGRAHALPAEARAAGSAEFDLAGSDSSSCPAEGGLQVWTAKHFCGAGEESEAAGSAHPFSADDGVVWSRKRKLSHTFALVLPEGFSSGKKLVAWSSVAEGTVEVVPPPGLAAGERLTIEVHFENGRRPEIGEIAVC